MSKGSPLSNTATRIRIRLLIDLAISQLPLFFNKHFRTLVSRTSKCCSWASKLLSLSATLSSHFISFNSISCNKAKENFKTTISASWYLTKIKLSPLKKAMLMCSNQRICESQIFSNRLFTSCNQITHLFFGQRTCESKNFVLTYQNNNNNNNMPAMVSLVFSDPSHQPKTTRPSPQVPKHWNCWTEHRAAESLSFSRARHVKLAEIWMFYILILSFSNIRKSSRAIESHFLCHPPHWSRIRYLEGIGNSRIHADCGCEVFGNVEGDCLWPNRSGIYFRAAVLRPFYLWEWLENPISMKRQLIP